MQLFVTGSHSFIGRRFIALARKAGNVVTGIDTVPGGADERRMDIRDDALSLAIPAGTDAVIHLAAISRDEDCRNDPRLAFDVNVMGTLNVARACRERGVRQLIFASSEWVYGQSGSSAQCEEDGIDVMRIAGEYALSKIVAERALALACPRDIADVTVLRFGIVYGPRPANWSAVESLYHKAATEPLITVGSRATARRFIHVDDIATGILAALGQRGFEVFNLSGDKLITLGEIIETSSRIHGTRPHTVETNASNANVRNPDNRKAKAVLGWRPVIELERGLRSLSEDNAPALAR